MIGAIVSDPVTSYGSSDSEDRAGGGRFDADPP
jgi:hypothetical protein